MTHLRPWVNKYVGSRPDLEAGGHIDQEVTCDIPPRGRLGGLILGVEK